MKNPLIYIPLLVLLLTATSSSGGVSQPSDKDPQTFTDATAGDEAPSPDGRLISAVRGVSHGAALFSFFVNPLLGVLVANRCDAPESNREIEEIDAALADGAHIDFQEARSGYTALIYAAYNGYPRAAQHLVAKNAKVDIKDNDGYNAYDMAKFYLTRYTNLLKTNEARELSESFTAEDKTSMRKHYQDYIARYQKLVDFLGPQQTGTFRT